MDTDDILDFDILDDREELESVGTSKFAILFILSLSLYGTWWVYKAWKYYKEKDGLDIMPVARAIFSIFFLYSLFERIQNDAKSKGYDQEYSSGGLFALFFGLNLAGRLPDPFWILSFLNLFTFIAPLKAFNWSIDQSESYSLVIPDKFNSRQIVILVLGIIFWVLIMIGMFLPDEGF